MVNQGGLETGGLRGLPLGLEIRINLSTIERLAGEEDQWLGLAHREPDRSRSR